MSHLFLPGGRYSPGSTDPRRRNAREVLDAWRRELSYAGRLERAYLFLRVLQDAQLLRRSTEQALPLARWSCPQTGQVMRPWWGTLLPDASDRQGRRLERLERLLAEQGFWRQLERLPGLPGFQGLSFRTGASWGPGAALSLAKLAALLREGPDGHAGLALAELATGRFARAEQRLAGLAQLAWERTSEDPERVRQHLALGRAVLAERRGDLATLRRELLSCAEFKRCPWPLLASLYVLALREGDDDGLAALRQTRLGPGMRGSEGLAHLPLGRWTADLGQGAKLRIARAVEIESGPWLELAQMLQREQVRK